MKRKFLLVISLIMVLILAACGPQATPGLNMTDVQNTALVLAMTGIAMTQSSMPTATPVPPTAIPVTELAMLITLPTSALETPIVAPVNNSTASPTPDCYQPPPAKLSGTQVQIRLVNKSDGPVDLSMGMYEPNDRGECYTFAFFVSKNSSETVTILSGCYWMAGYQNGPKPSTPRVNYICLTDTSQTRGISINNNSIGFD